MYYVTHERRVSCGRESAISKGYKLWTEERDQELKRLYLVGLSVNDISTILNRTPAAIRVRANRLHISNRRRNFTREEVAYLRKHYGIKSVIEISEHLGRNETSIRLKAYFLGLGGRYFGSNHPKSVLSDHDVELVRQLAEAGLSYAAIAEKMEISKSHVSILCRYKCRLGLTFGETH